MAYSKASKFLGVIARIIAFKSRHVLIQPYKTSCSHTWSQSVLHQLFEYTKHRFSHGSRVEDVAIWRSFSFKERWKCAHLIKVFKLYKGYSLLPFEQFFTVSRVACTRGHSVKIEKHHCQIVLRKHFFSERVIYLWDSLHQDLIDAVSRNLSKSWLEKSWHTKMARICYSHNGQLVENPMWTVKYYFHYQNGLAGVMCTKNEISSLTV